MEERREPDTRYILASEFPKMFQDVVIELRNQHSNHKKEIMAYIDKKFESVFEKISHITDSLIGDIDKPGQITKFKP